MAIRKRTNNDLQYTTQKTNDRATQTLLKIDNKTEVFRNVDTYKWKIHNCGVNIMSFGVNVIS
jgi:hypothetical protein